MANGFSAGLSDFPGGNVTGFGLWLKDRDSYWGRVSSGGFSWDWFDLEAGNVYRKLQGPGRVRITRTSPASPAQQIASVEILEDITLRAKVRPWFLFFLDSDTHNLVVKKGSVLRFAQ